MLPTTVGTDCNTTCIFGHKTVTTTSDSILVKVMHVLVKLIVGSPQLLGQQPSKAALGYPRSYLEAALKQFKLVHLENPRFIEPVYLDPTALLDPH